MDQDLNSMEDSGRSSNEPTVTGTYEVVYDLLRARVKTGCVLDAPCGGGAFTRRLVESRVYRVAAADFERRPGVPEVDFRLADINERLPFPNDSFDAVVSIDGIEQVEEPFRFVRECNRLLRPGGLLFLATPNISSVRSRWRWLLTGFHSKSAYPAEEQNPGLRHRMNMVSFPELRYMLHTSGFRIDCISTNRSRPMSRLYGALVPLQFSLSLLAFRRAAKNEEHRRQIGEVLRQMMSAPILFGESLIVVATETMKAACLKQPRAGLSGRRAEFGEMLWGGEPTCRAITNYQLRITNHE